MRSGCAYSLCPLGEVLLALKDGTHGTHRRIEHGVPLLSAKNISQSGTIIWNDADDKIPESEYQAITRSFHLKADDLLLTTVGSLGRRALHDGSKITFQRSVAYLRTDPEKATPRYLFHVAAADDFQRALVRRSNATAQAGLYLGELSRISVPIPTLTEQRVIAEILDTLDEAIRRTEQIVDKLKQIKQGLLHDLLTRGIDENGEIRDPERHPEQFEASSIGSIPAAWQVRKISDLCLRVTYGFTNPMPTTTDGPWMLTAAEVGYDEIDWESARHTSELAFSRLTQKSRPAPGDVLVTKDGTLGRVAIVNRDRVCVNQSVAVLKPKSQAGASYINDYLLSPIGQERMLTDTGGSTIRHIYISRLAQMELPIPTDPEAARISSVIQVFTDRIRTEAEELQKLGLIKQGLMEDLLTGRVRVTNLEIAA
jgi:type I restriction enzyme S subunit